MRKVHRWRKATWRDWIAGRKPTTDDYGRTYVSDDLEGYWVLVEDFDLAQREWEREVDTLRFENERLRAQLAEQHLREGKP